MADEHVKDWIEKKLERGVDEDRIRSTLEKTGRDPGLVDEVKAPFDDDERPEEEASDLHEEFAEKGSEDAEESEEEDSEQDEDESEETEEAEGSGEQTQESEEEEVEEQHETQEAEQASEPENDTEHVEDEEGSSGLDSLKYVDHSGSGEEQDEREEKEDAGRSFSLPSFSLPSVSLPASKIRSRMILPIVILLLVAGIGYAGMNLMDGEGSTSAVTKAFGPSCSGGSGVGVKLYSAGESNGQTLGDVYTEEEAKVVLEVFSGEEKLGESSKVIDGRGMIRVNAVGNRAVLHEVGCEEPSESKNY